MCAGRVYLMAWEDGQAGVYRMDSTTRKQISKSHVLMDSSDGAPALVDNLMEKTEQQAVNLMLEHDKRNVTTDASYARASLLLGICNNLDFDGPSPVPATHERSAASTSPLAQMALPATSSSTSVGVRAINAGGDDETESTKGIMGGMTGMSFLRNSCNGLQAPSPSEPKAKAKATAKAAARGTKNKAGANPDPEKKTKKQRTSCVETVGINAKSGSQSVALKLKEDDDAWRSEHRSKVDELLQFSPGASDTDFKNDIAECNKRVNTLQATIRGRKRTVKRRSEDNQRPALAEAQELEDMLSAFGNFLKNLSKGTSSQSPSDEMCATVETLIKNGAVFGKQIYVRIVKQRWCEDMTYKRWTNMLTCSLEWVKTRCEDFDMDELLGQQMNVVLQKLLKGIPAEKAAWRGSDWLGAEEVTG